MSKFTPGPWLAKTYTNHALQTDFAMVMMGDWVHMIGYSDEDKANAALIAAAPAMYEALRNALEALELEQCDEYGKPVWHQDEIKQIKAALRAADGGE